MTNLYSTLDVLHEGENSCLSITSPFPIIFFLLSRSLKLKLSVFSNLLKAQCLYCLETIQYWVLLKKLHLNLTNK